MENLEESDHGFSDQEEEEFRSCFAEDDEWRDAEESVIEDEPSGDFCDELGEFCCKMFFKGVSVTGSGGDDLGSTSVSGIGVVMEKSNNDTLLQVRKKLEFYVEESVAEQLALMDGLLSALKIGARRILAFTDSTVVYDQIARAEKLENQLLMALRQRILEHAGKLEAFVLKLVPSSDLKKPLRLAQEAIGMIEDCPICCEEKQPWQMVTINCSHKFCSHCMITYVDKKLQASQVPVRCPQPGCKYYISAGECKSFLPVTCYNSLLKVLAEADIHDSEKIYCPHLNCSVLLNLRQCLSSRASSSSQSEPVTNSCLECPECRRFLCADCGVPWHSSMSCEEYQNLPAEERDAGDITLHRLAQNNKWRRCQQCRRMIELTQGCYHMTCWCGHEFCYSCGAEYRERQQTCQCAFWDDENLIAHPTLPQETELWRWEGDYFDSTDGYTDHERAQWALIQRFLAGGFSLNDLPLQAPPPSSDSYMDAIKDLHQLPWLERFVSVISDDSYFDDYVPQ